MPSPSCCTGVIIVLNVYTSEHRYSNERARMLQMKSFMNLKPMVCVAGYVVICALFFSCVFPTVLLRAASQDFRFLLIVDVLLLLLFVAAFALLAKRCADKPEFLFLAVAIPGCFVFCLFMLPNYVPDEIWHIFRVVDIWNDGNSMWAPRELDLELLPTNYGEYLSCLLIPGQYADGFTVDRLFASYSPVLYLVPGLVCYVGELASVNVFVLIIIARFVNAALFVVAGYWMIKLVPFARPLMMIYLLNPMLLQQECSCSADALTNILILLFIVFALHIRVQERPTRRQWVILIILTISIFVAKYAYAPIALILLMFVPRIKSKRVRASIYVCLGAVAVGAIVFVAFYPYNNDSTIGCMISLFKDPVDCVIVFKNAILDYAGVWIETFAGSALGPLSIGVWKPVVFLYWIILVCAVFVSTKERFSLKSNEKVLFVIVGVFTSILMISAFRQWSIDVHNMYDSITGVQGRYFIPVFALFFLAAFNHKKYVERLNSPVVFACLCALILLFDTYSLLCFF